MNSKHRKTLASLFATPTPANIEWMDVERLMLAVGCKLVEGAGSRVTFVYQGHIESFHRPHPAKEAKRYQIRQARDFFDRIGVRP